METQREGGTARVIAEWLAPVDADVTYFSMHWRCQAWSDGESTRGHQIGAWPGRCETLETVEEGAGGHMHGVNLLVLWMAGEGESFAQPSSTEPATSNFNVGGEEPLPHTSSFEDRL